MTACALMIDCRFQLQLDAYHDRELDADARREFEEHLKECPSCPGELAAMRALSSRIEAAIPHDITSAESMRVHEAVNHAADPQPESYPLLRTAGLLSALAASVLIISGVWLLDIRSSRTTTFVKTGPSTLAPEWERVATTLRANPRIRINDDMFFSPHYASTVDWMLSNLVPTERKPWVKPGSS